MQIVVALATVFGTPRVLDDPVRHGLLTSEDGSLLGLTVTNDQNTVVHCIRAAQEASPEVTVRVSDTFHVELHHVRVDTDRNRTVRGDVFHDLIFGVLWNSSRSGEVHVMV